MSVLVTGEWSAVCVDQRSLVSLVNKPTSVKVTPGLLCGVPSTPALSVSLSLSLSLSLSRSLRLQHDGP